MTIMFLVLLLIMGLICTPAYLSSRRKGGETKWFLTSALPALAIWIGLTASGYGAQSLANSVEVFYISLATVVLSYLKVYLVDRKLNKPKQTTYTMMALLAIAAFLLRTFMPLIPE